MLPTKACRATGGSPGAVRAYFGEQARSDSWKSEGGTEERGLELERLMKDH
jgi:hypothetical protein